ncbi:Thiouridylase cytoplasmic subunit 2 [Penicillium verhagenii]|uniref:Thiouridylase cytoplasmic subunit 2 n=1 Tax=Penicillium verhagenii TaxID=1562060 RepID=UPI0025451DF7|nr:Thiouridylase cytoplasmic subunit 2 [Penicillium verhagenii]KAJ5939125.1 Thiouridylase cytoplasmic subunit 2 [Penicillium verhagenii]
MPAKEMVSPCMECNDADAVLTTRGRSLCGPCYRLFLEYKVWRRMDHYRPRPQRSAQPTAQPAKPQLLLPLSLGVSSAALLNILDVALKRQLAKSGRPAYAIHILVVEPSTVSPVNVSCDTNIEAVREVFSDYPVTKVPLHSVFDYVSDMKDILAEYAGPHFFDDASQPNDQRLAAFRGIVSTATSKTDLNTVLFTRLVVGFAKHAGCESILWADTDTRLAAKTLAGAAKGRGAALTWQVSDGMSPWGVKFEFPCRDISKPEISEYASVCPAILNVIIPDAPLSENILTKNMSIDELMMRYVTNQGEKYPGVMANVSRTANKLESPSVTEDALCSLCGAMIENVKGNETGITVASQFAGKGSKFCYGCMRSRPDIIL